MSSASIDHRVIDHALSLMEGLGTSLAQSTFMLVKAGEWDQLASRKVSPLSYLDANGCKIFGLSARGVFRYRCDIAAVDFLRKCPMLPTTYDKAKAAKDNFYLAERQCFFSNERISKFIFGSFTDPELPQYFLLDTARKKISSWLGRCPEMHELLEDCRFGPGSTYADKGKLCTVPDKMTSRPNLTASAMGFLFPWVETKWGQASLDLGRTPDFVPGNRFTTVPKDGVKDRGIAIEPSLNVFFQLALGRVLKRRLKFRAGIDLREGMGIHQAKACEASLTGEYATIDLSNASDTVCRNLVKFLIPANWFELFDALRSPKTKIDGKWVVLEKFSSMGNGYTFELESLIFLGLCAAAIECCGGSCRPGLNTWVFGDDIIVPVEYSNVVLSTLRFAGFSPNVDKTFTSGPFRESCGGDYFEGLAVRPHQLDSEKYEIPEQIALANGLRRLGRLNGPDDYFSTYLSRTWLRVLDAIPSGVRVCRGPESFGDICIHDEEGRWFTRTRYSIRRLKVFMPQVKTYVSWDHWHPSVQLATCLYGVGDGLKGITPRKPLMSYRLGWVPYS